MKLKCEYRFKEDIAFILEAMNINVLELSEGTAISRRTLEKALREEGRIRDDTHETLFLRLSKTRGLIRR